jgi:hypothetical protein
MQGQDGNRVLVDQDKVERRAASRVVVITGREHCFWTPQDTLRRHYAEINSSNGNRFTGEPLTKLEG